MFRLIQLFAPAMMAAFLAVPYLYMKTPPSLPKIDVDEWWGEENLKGNVTEEIRPFKVQFTKSMIKYIKDRLRSAHPLVPPLEGTAFQYGFNSDELRKWMHYWAEKYPFGKREKYMNKYPQFMTNIQGLDIHFVRVKPKDTYDADVIPLLLLHGWPGCYLEFYEAIDFLTSVSKNQSVAIEVIAPSLPGYGWSSAALRPGLAAHKVAVVLRNLMHRLGYKKFYVQGGDWGSGICRDMVTLFPEEILGHHTNLPLLMTPAVGYAGVKAFIDPFFEMNSDIQNSTSAVSNAQTELLRESAYFHLQATRPDTIGVGLTDSPGGFAGYVLEKFSSWTRIQNRNRPDGGLTQYFSKDRLLDIVMVYYVSGSITSSMRLYAETFNPTYLGLQLDQIPSKVPTIAVQPEHEIIPSSSVALKIKYPNLIRYEIFENGGHFLAFESPQRYAKMVVKAMEDFKAWHEENGYVV